MVVIIKNNWFANFNCYKECTYFISHSRIHSALVLDSYAHDQTRVEPYGIQAVKDIEAFLQIASRSITINPCPYKVRTCTGFHPEISVSGGSGHGSFTHHVPPLPIIIDINFGCH